MTSHITPLDSQINVHVESIPEVMDTQVGVISGLMTPALNHGKVPERHHWARLPSTWGTIVHLILLGEVLSIIPYCLMTLSLAR